MKACLLCSEKLLFYTETGFHLRTHGIAADEFFSLSDKIFGRIVREAYIMILLVGSAAMNYKPVQIRTVCNALFNKFYSFHGVKIDHRHPSVSCGGALRQRLGMLRIR